MIATPSHALAPKTTPEMLVPRTAKAAKAYAAKQMPSYGWNAKHFVCLTELWRRESNWRADAYNHTPVYQVRNGKRVKLHAGGIPQRLGLNPKATVQVQIKVGLDYIQNRYGNPCRALAKHNASNWY